MANKIWLHPLVAKDLAAALDWYDGISIELGNRYRSAINQALKEIRIAPERYAHPFDNADQRYRRVRKFPYLILYRIKPEIIRIEGVFHTASDPEEWRSRAL